VRAFSSCEPSPRASLLLVRAFSSYEPSPRASPLLVRALFSYDFPPRASLLLVRAFSSCDPSPRTTLLIARLPRSYYLSARTTLLLPVCVLTFLIVNFPLFPLTFIFDQYHQKIFARDAIWALRCEAPQLVVSDMINLIANSNNLGNFACAKTKM
jgi:hypothetical protein